MSGTFFANDKMQTCGEASTLIKLRGEVVWGEGEDVMWCYQSLPWEVQTKLIAFQNTVKWLRHVRWINSTVDNSMPTGEFPYRPRDIVWWNSQHLRSSRRPKWKHLKWYRIRRYTEQFAALRPQNEKASPTEVFNELGGTTYNGTTVWDGKAEILILEEFLKRQETVNWSPGIWPFTYSTTRNDLSVGKKNEKWGMFPARHTEDFKSQLHLAVSCRFQNIWAPPLWVNFGHRTPDQTFYSAIVIYFVVLT